MTATANTPLHFTPKILVREHAALYCGLSTSTLEKGVRQKTFPQPRLLADRRVGWRVDELDVWCESRPVSNLLPPANTSAKKPRIKALPDPQAGH
jgi:prophage regulatory protein